MATPTAIGKHMRPIMLSRKLLPSSHPRCYRPEGCKEEETLDRADYREFLDLAQTLDPYGVGDPATGNFVYGNGVDECQRQHHEPQTVCGPRAKDGEGVGPASGGHHIGGVAATSSEDSRHHESDGG